MDDRLEVITNEQEFASFASPPLGICEAGLVWKAVSGVHAGWFGFNYVNVHVTGEVSMTYDETCCLVQLQLVKLPDGALLVRLGTVNSPVRECVVAYDTDATYEKCAHCGGIVRKEEK